MIEYKYVKIYNEGRKMSQITRNAITESTLKLAAQRPIKKITVKDITNDCGITRNTFYYYFKDIYDVLDIAFCNEISKAMGDDGKAFTNDESFFELAEFVLKNKAVFKNVYNIMGDKKMKSYLNEKIHDMTMAYIRGEAVGLNASEEDLAIIAVFYEEALAGIVIRWLKGDMPKGVATDITEMAHKMRTIFAGLVRNAVENSLKLK
jgi:AcrR family transcriptional regulator